MNIAMCEPFDIFDSPDLKEILEEPENSSTSSKKFNKEFQNRIKQSFISDHGKSIPQKSNPEEKGEKILLTKEELDLRRKFMGL